MDDHGMDGRYNEDYYLRGEAKGVSNYTNYRWMEDRTMAMARRLVEVMGIERGDSFLDVGCALGFTVKALRRLGIEAYGQDISQWAVKNCDPEVADYVHTNVLHERYDHILMKDLCEHLEAPALKRLVDQMLSMVVKSVLVIVPLSEKASGPYIRAEDNKDVTHVIRWPLEQWMRFLQRPTEEFIVSGSWHIPGLKPTSLSCLGSCGFITLTRHEANTGSSEP
jgi:hypothetical protein